MAFFKTRIPCFTKSLILPRGVRRGGAEKPAQKILKRRAECDRFGAFRRGDRDLLHGLPTQQHAKRSDRLPRLHRRGDALRKLDDSLQRALLRNRHQHAGGRGRFKPDLPRHAAGHRQHGQRRRFGRRDLPVGKAVVEQACRRGKAVVRVGRAEHDADQRHAVALGGRGNAAARRAGRAGLQARDAVVGADELVRVDELRLAAAHVIDPDRRVIEDLLVLHQGAAHHRHIVGARDVAVLVEAVAVFKNRIAHAELRRARIHALDERLLRAGDGFGEHDRRVVGAHDDAGLDEVVHRHLLALLEPDVRAAHARRMRRGRQHVVVVQRAAVDRLEHEQQRHHLRDRSARPDLVRIFLIKHLAGRKFHQHSGRRGHVEPLGRCRRRERNDKRAEHPGDEQQRHRPFFLSHSNAHNQNRPFLGRLFPQERPLLKHMRRRRRFIP